SSSASAWSDWVGGFVQGMHEHGWIEGRTVNIEYRWADGRSERYGEIATEFARLKVVVIVTVGSAVRAAQRSTSAIPIVFAIATDPDGGGLITSLRRLMGFALRPRMTSYHIIPLMALLHYSKLVGSISAQGHVPTWPAAVSNHARTNLARKRT